jgi:hypothetical protein
MDQATNPRKAGAMIAFVLSTNRIKKFLIRFSLLSFFLLIHKFASARAGVPFSQRDKTKTQTYIVSPNTMHQSGRVLRDSF